MEFKEIKPGMVIHCPTKEDLCELLKHLTDLGYRGHGCIIKGEYSGEWCICILENKKVKYVSIDDEAGYTITEFSDLIEPDSPINSPINSPMSAKDILEWFRKAETKDFEKLFSCDNIAEIFDYHTNDEIVRVITAYEAAKKAPKPVEVEEGYFCELYEKRDNCNVVILGYDMWSADKNTAIKDVQEKARKQVIKTGKPCYSRVTYKCRVKEGES